MNPALHAAPPPPEWMVMVFPVFFVGLWCTACFSIAQFGWNDFARLYRVEKLPQGQSYRGQSGRFNLQGSYGRTLNIIIAPEGIGLSQMILFRCGHPPLLVPWSSVAQVEVKAFFFFAKYLCVTMTGGTRIFKLRLSMEAEEEVAKYKPLTSA